MAAVFNPVKRHHYGLWRRSSTFEVGEHLRTTLIDNGCSTGHSAFTASDIEIKSRQLQQCATW
jgi:hypothetical protein